MEPGKILYHHAQGRQSLDNDAPQLDPDSTIALGSAGKFITHIAALQLVESGAIELDDPIYKHLPELEALPLVKYGSEDETLELCPPTKEITLRHLLLHTSGLSTHRNPLVSRYFESDCEKPKYEEDAPYIVKHFSVPLIFEPGDGFAYGHSIHWVQMVITRLTKNFLNYIRDHIFQPLGMSSSAYLAQNIPHIWDKRLRMVERVDNKLVHTDDGTQSLMCSITDMAIILGDLISPSPKLLKQEHIELLFTGQLAPSSAALEDLRGNHENFAFCAGLPGGAGPPLVNWSAGGLVVEAELPVSCMPKGTVTWEGLPNVLWAMNREKRLAMFFGTQLIPVGDRIANELATTFMKDAWNKFG